MSGNFEPTQMWQPCLGIVWMCLYCTETDNNTDSHWVLCTQPLYTITVFSSMVALFGWRREGGARNATAKISLFSYSFRKNWSNNRCPPPSGKSSRSAAVRSINENEMCFQAWNELEKMEKYEKGKKVREFHERGKSGNTALDLTCHIFVAVTLRTNLPQQKRPPQVLQHLILRDALLSNKKNPIPR